MDKLKSTVGTETHSTTINAKPTKRQGIFFGWWLVASGTVVWALQAGVYFYGFGTFFTALINEFGWSRTALSFVFSLSRLESGIAGPMVGFLIDRFGTRRLMLAGFILAGLGYVLLSQANTFVIFSLIFVIVLSVGASLGFTAPPSAAVTNWFRRRRSLAFGIMTCGVGLGGLSLPLMAWSIDQHGWRLTAVACGILLIGSGIPLSLVMRHKPEPYGYLPDGDAFSTCDEEEAGNRGTSPVGTGAPAAMSGEGADDMGFTVKQALATSAFWMLSLTFAARGVVNGGIGVHEIPALENIGFSREAAAAVLMAMTIISIPGRLLFGWLGDRFDKRYVIGICLAMQALGLTAFALATDLSLIIVFLVVLSPAYGGLVPLFPATLAEYFGRKHFATINGLSGAITMWGIILGPVLAGYLFDISSSYQLAFLLLAAANLLGISMLLFVRRPHLKPALEPVAFQSI